MQNYSFYSIIKLLFYSDSTDLAKDLFYVQDQLTEDFGIIYTTNLEMLELVVRTLARLDLKFKLNLEFKILGCPEDQKEFIGWFVKFFMLLESLDDYGFDLTEEHKDILYNEYSPYDGELDMKPNYKEFRIKFI